jgi:plastocyanin
VNERSEKTGSTVLKTSIAAVILTLLAACQTLPDGSRTGRVTNIVITEALSQDEVTVRPGDEVRWINKRAAPVRIHFMQPIEDQLTCKSGFGNWFQQTKVATLATDDTASACFRESGTIRYAVMMKKPDPLDEIKETGLVRVE